MDVTSPGWAARAAAALAWAAVPLHVWMFAVAPHGGLTVLMSAMTLGCAACAVHVWRAGHGTGSRSPLMHLWWMAAAMAVLHAALLAGPPGLTGGHAGHGGSLGHGPGGGGLLMAVIVALDLAVGLCCAVALRRIGSPAPRAPSTLHYRGAGEQPARVPRSPHLLDRRRRL